MSDEFYEAKEKLVSDALEQNKIANELVYIKTCREFIGRAVAIRQRELMAQTIWWENFGSSATHLQKCAIRV